MYILDYLGEAQLESELEVEVFSSLILEADG